MKRLALATAVAVALAVPGPAPATAGTGVWTSTLQATQGFDHLSAFPDGTFYAQYLDTYARSKDFGATWQVMPRPPRQQLGSPGIRFATPMIGWSVSGTGAGAEDGFDAAKFADEVVRCGGLTPLHRTVDGGTTWQPVCVPNTRLTDVDPQFAPGASGLAVGRDGRSAMLAGSEMRPNDGHDCGEYTDAIYSTRDAGKTWTQARLPYGWANGYRSQVLDSSTMAHLAYHYEEGRCESGTVGLFVSRDGGKSFKVTYVCRVQPTCTSVALVSRTHFVLGRTDGSTLVSKDGGRTWHRGQRLFEPAYQPAIDSGQLSPYVLWVQSMSFFDSRNGFASTRGSGTWRTTDGGLSWTQERSPECVLMIPGVGEIAAGSRTAAITGGPHFISARTEVAAGAPVGCVPSTSNIPTVNAAVVRLGGLTVLADGTVERRG